MKNDKSSPLLPQQGGEQTELVGLEFLHNTEDACGCKHSHYRLKRFDCETGAVLPQVGEAKPQLTLPEMPPSVFKHPTLGPMWDRLEMHFYAVRHADAMVKLLSAVSLQGGEAITLENAPVGTKAPSSTGGHWYRTQFGWKWNGPDGSMGNWNGKLIAPAVGGEAKAVAPLAENELWDLLDTVGDALSRRAAPHAWESVTRNAGYEFIMKRRAAAPVAEALPVAADLAPGETMIGRARPYAKELDWATGKWDAEVANRPLVNVNRRTLDDTWRQVIRYFGGDDVSLCGPRHDDLVRGEKQ